MPQSDNTSLEMNLKDCSIINCLIPDGVLAVLTFTECVITELVIAAAFAESAADVLRIVFSMILTS